MGRAAGRMKKARAVAGPGLVRVAAMPQKE